MMKDQDKIKTVTLPQLCNNEGLFVDGDWIESKDQNPNGDVRLIQMMDIGEGEYLNKSSRFLTSEKAKELKCTYLKPGDILISIMPDPIGRACIFPGDPKKCVTAVDVCIVRPDNNLVDSNWLLRKINSPTFRNKIGRWTTGTTRKRISRGNLAKIKFSLPSLPEQKHIAVILNKADEIRKKRQQAIEELNKLIPAIFYDMFGDPIKNTKGFPSLPLERIVANEQYALKRGPFGGSLKKEIFVPSGYKIYEQMHAINNDFSIGRYFIDDSKYDEMKPFAVKPGDLIISCSGTVGKVAIVPEDASPGIINQALLKITPNIELVSALYLKILLESEPAQRHLYGIARGSGIKNFPPMNVIRALPIPIPDVSLLKQFHKACDEATRLFSNALLASESADNLFNSLVQRAFKGEL